MEREYNKASGADSDARTERILAHVRSGHSVAFVVPGNLRKKEDGTSSGLIEFGRLVLESGFGYIKVKSRADGKSRQVMVLYETDSVCEQDLVRFAVSAARGFDQAEVYFADQNGFGYVAVPVERHGFVSAEEYPFDGEKRVPVPVKVTEDCVESYLVGVLGERFFVGPDNVPADKGHGGGRNRRLIRKYGYECMDCLASQIFTGRKNLRPDGAVGEIWSFVRSHFSFAVIALDGDAEEGERMLEKIREFALAAMFLYCDVRGTEPRGKEAVVVISEWDDREEDILFPFAVSAAERTGMEHMLYVDTFGRGWKVTTSEETLSLGEKKPWDTAPGKETGKITSEDVEKHIRDLLGGNFVTDGAHGLHMNMRVGFRANKMMGLIRVHGFRCLDFFYDGLLRPDERPKQRDKGREQDTLQAGFP